MWTRRAPRCSASASRGTNPPQPTSEGGVPDVRSIGSSSSRCSAAALIVAPLAAQSDVPPRATSRRPDDCVPRARSRRAPREAPLHDAHRAARTARTSSRRRAATRSSGSSTCAAALVSSSPRKLARRRTSISSPRAARSMRSSSRRSRRTRARTPDLTVYLEPDDPAVAAAGRDQPKYVPAQQLEDFRAQADLAREQARRATETARAALDAGLTAFRTTYPLGVAVSVSLQGGREAVLRARDVSRRPSDVHPVARRGTARRSTSSRTARPNLVNFDVQDGTTSCRRCSTTGI